MYRKFVCMTLVVACLALDFSGLFLFTLNTAAVAEGVQTTPAPVTAPEVYRELLNGSVDAEGENHVFMLQAKLIELSYMTGTADGHYGTQTEDAIYIFQQMNGLVATGVADIDTQMMLYTSSQIVPAPTPAPTPRINGTTGDDIKAAQEKLAQWGFLDGTADGVYGNNTEVAVKAYKEYIYAKSNPVTAAEPAPTIASDAATADGGEDAVPAGAFDSMPTPTPYAPDGEIGDELLATMKNNDFQIYIESMSNGSKGQEVVRLQTRLSQLGYMYIGPSGADGAYGSLTEAAVKYFQRLNNLDQTGSADEEMQKILFSAGAEESDEKVFPYKLIIDISEQRVYAYRWTGDGYGEKARTMKCSTGTKKDPTPLGTYSCDGRAGDWYYFKKFDCWARYAYRIYGGYLFHSVLYNKKDTSTLSKGSVYNLGKRASHGCIRLAVEDAKWIYDNCPNGITVVIRE